MSQAKITIVKLNREKIIIENAAITTDPTRAEIMLITALALNNLTSNDIKIAEYTIDGNHVFGYLRQADGLHTLTPAK